MYNFDLAFDMVQRYSLARIDETISPQDPMANEWYFDVGRSAIENIVIACLVSKVRQVRRVLDLPCGYGRVLRHLVRLFPEAQCDACDIDRGAVEFCARTFGVTPITSMPDPSDLRLAGNYDLIWVGSLFTHESQALTSRWMRRLSAALSDRGIIVASVHEIPNMRVYLYRERGWADHHDVVVCGRPDVYEPWPQTALGSAKQAE